MGDVSIAWGAAALCAVAALVLLVRVAGEGKRRQEQAAQLDSLQKEVRNTKKQLEQQTKAHRKSVAEVDRLKRHGGKAQKQAAREKGGAREERSRLRELEEALARSNDELASRDAAHATTRESLARAVDELAVAQNREREAAAALARAIAAQAPVVDESVLASLTERADRAEAVLREREEALLAANTETQRLRKKLATEEKLYLSIRGELSIKKDLVRQQREELERLRAFKVAVIDEPVAAADTPVQASDAPVQDAGEAS